MGIYLPNNLKFIFFITNYEEHPFESETYQLPYFITNIL